MPAGRPPKKVDTERLESLGQIGATDEEIARALGISSDTLVKNFSESLENARAEGKISLRAKQFLLAMGRDAQPAEYLKEDGKLVKDKDGNYIKIKEATPERLPNLGALIWLGKNLLKQGDRVVFDEPEEWKFV